MLAIGPGGPVLLIVKETPSSSWTTAHDLNFLDLRSKIDAFADIHVVNDPSDSLGECLE